MKIIAFLLSSLFVSTLFGQMELQHRPLKKGDNYMVFPYTDGSFTVFTNSDKEGHFVSYDKEGKIEFEKKIDISNVAEIFIDPNTKELFSLVVGTGFHIANINYRGDNKFITILEGKQSLLLSGAAWTGEHKISAVVTVLGDARLITFNTKDFSYTITPLIKNQILGKFSELRFIGTRDGNMVFLGSIPADPALAEVVTILPGGTVSTTPCRLTEPIDRITFALIKRVEVLDTENDNLYFAVPAINTFRSQTIYRIGLDGKIGYVEWKSSTSLEEAEKDDPKNWRIISDQAFMRKAVLFYVYGSGKDDQLVYSFGGYNMARYVPDWNNHSVSEFDPDTYNGPIQLTSSLDLLLYLQDHPGLAAQKERIFECGSENSSCLHTVRAIYNADKTIGFLVITGDKVEYKTRETKNYKDEKMEIKYYNHENVKIFKY